MKKAVRNTLIVTGSVVAVLVAVIIALSLVNIKPAGTLNGYSRVELYDIGSTERIEVESGSYPDDMAKLNKALGSTEFSIMQGMLEGRLGSDLAFETAGDERVEIEANAIESTTTANQYKLVFIYDEVKTVTVEGETLSFDRAIVTIGDSSNEIRTMRAVFYLYSRIGNQATDEDLASEYYSVTPVLIKARTTELYNAVGEIISERKQR